MFAQRPVPPSRGAAHLHRRAVRRTFIIAVPYRTSRRLSTMSQSEKRRDASARNAGFRSLRLEELFRQELNLLLDGEVHDPRLDGARVTRVELSRDGSSARVWFTLPAQRERATSPGETPPRMSEGVSPSEAREAFERAAGFLRSRLCDAVALKRVPDLRFRHDPVLVGDPDPYA
jgi:ribosome-binding factor A